MTSKIRITLRLPEELIKTIRKRAKEMGISVNAYISMVLSREASESK